MGGRGRTNPPPTELTLLELRLGENPDVLTRPPYVRNFARRNSPLQTCCTTVVEMLLTNGRCCTQVADCVIASFLAIGIVVVMEVTQAQWNRDCATARRVLRSGGIGILAAEDLVQEAWLSFLRNGHDGRHMARKLGFLYRTACRDKGRAKRFVEMGVDPVCRPRGDVGEALESLRACGLSGVSEAVFEGLLMGLTRMEIARRLDLTIATVNWIVARWRDRVAEGVCHAGRSRRGDPGDSREHDGGRG